MMELWHYMHDAFASDGLWRKTFRPSTTKLQTRAKHLLIRLFLAATYMVVVSLHHTIQVLPVALFFLLFISLLPFWIYVIHKCHIWRVHIYTVCVVSVVTLRRCRNRNDVISINLHTCSENNINDCIECRQMTYTHSPPPCWHTYHTHI